MSRERERIIRPWLTLVLSAGVLLSMAAAFQSSGDFMKSVDPRKPTGLSIATLESRLASRPNQPRMLEVLAWQYATIGHWDSALKTANRLSDLGGTQNQGRALLVRIYVAEQQAFEFPVGSPQRQQALNRFHDRLLQSEHYQWDVPAMERLVVLSHDSGSYDVMNYYYPLLAERDPARAKLWYARYGKASLDSQHYQEAAQAFFKVEDLAQGVDDKRHAFMAAVGALEAGNRVKEACDAADQHMSPLASDAQSVVYMLKLSRMAGRHDLEVRYARLLLQLSQNDNRMRFGQGRVYSDSLVYAGGIYLDGVHGAVSGGGLQRTSDTVSVPLAPNPEPAAPTIDSSDSTFVQDVTPEIEKPSGNSEGSAAVGSVTHSGPDENYELMYESFVGNQKLSDAQALCEKALKNHQDTALWTKRLAQVSQWNGQGKTALANWLNYARISNEEEAWQNVMRISRQVNDDHAYLAALLHESARQPNDMELVGKVVATYERLAEPENSLAFLEKHATGTMKVPLLERYAQVAEDLGQDDRALAVYEKLQAQFGPSQAYALEIADLQLRHKRSEAAFLGLAKIQSMVGTSKRDAPYWRAYAELANMTHRDKLANYGNKKLLETGGFDTNDIKEMESYYFGYPYDAGRLYELEFHRSGELHSLLAALNSYSNAKAWGRVRALLSSLTPAQTREYERSVPFLMARADFYEKSGQWSRAIDDMRSAMAMSGAGDSQRVDYLWALVDFGRDDELRAALHRWQVPIESDSAYWGVAGAAYVRLNDSQNALKYLKRQTAEMKNDPQWLLILSYAEEDAGDEASAWRLRRLAWNRITALVNAPLQPGVSVRNLSQGNTMQPASPVLDSDGTESPLVTRASLSEMFVNGDRSFNYLEQMLQQRRYRYPAEGVPANTESLLGDLSAFKDFPLSSEDGCLEGANATGTLDPKKQTLILSERCRISNVAKDVTISWALGGEHNDLARAWLAGEYGQRLLHATDARIALALAENDRDALDKIVQDKESHVQVDQRVEALDQLGRRADAQTTAFAAGESARGNTARHEIERNTLLTPVSSIGQALDPSPGPYWSPQGYFTPSLVVGMNETSWSPYYYVEKSAGVGVQLSNEYSLDLEGIVRNQEDTNRSLLNYVPATDRVVAVTLQDHTNVRDYALTVGQRSELTTFNTYSGSAQFNWSPALVGRLMAGWNQFTDLSPVLQLVGVKNMVEGAIDWQFAPRWFFHNALEADRFNTQMGDYLGNGMLYSAELGYQLLTNLPNWNVRLVTYQGRYNNSGVALPRLASIVPAGNVANSGFFMPGNIDQYGVMTGYGTDYENNYSRSGWQPYVDAGIVRDTALGNLPQVSTGLVGPILGKDYARIYYFHETAPGSTSSMTQVGASYRMFY